MLGFGAKPQDKMVLNRFYDLAFYFFYLALPFAQSKNKLGCTSRNIVPRAHFGNFSLP